MIADVGDEAFTIGQELVSIATNVDFGDLRGEMAARLIRREIHGVPYSDRLLLVTRVLAHALATIEVMADDIARTAELRVLLDALVEHPDHAEVIAKLGIEEPKTLRRPAEVDEQLRERDV